MRFSVWKCSAREWGQSYYRTLIGNHTKSNAIYRMVPLSLTLSNIWLRFQGHYLQVEYLTDGARIQCIIVQSSGALSKRCKNWVSSLLNFFCYHGRKFFYIGGGNKPWHLYSWLKLLHRHSLSEENFGYNSGRLKSSASHACREIALVRNEKKSQSHFEAMSVRFQLASHVESAVCGKFSNCQLILTGMHIWVFKLNSSQLKGWSQWTFDAPVNICNSQTEPKFDFIYIRQHYFL